LRDSFIEILSFSYMLNAEHILALIEQKMPQALVSSKTSYDGVLSVETTREQVIDLLRFLKEDEQLNFHFLTTLCGVHYPKRTGKELGVVYHLHNWISNMRLRVTLSVPSADPTVPTATVLWPSANWMERQEYDFFGFQFVGHPDLRRILNVDDMEVFPMRKEYRLEDGTRTDKDDRFFGRTGHEGQQFD
jgi:NADH-quinone oxidoreductase subunit C